MESKGVGREELGYLSTHSTSGHARREKLESGHDLDQEL